MKIAQKALQVALMLRRCFMVRFLELRVPDVGFAMLAPVFGLFNISKSFSRGDGHLPSISSIQTSCDGLFSGVTRLLEQVSSFQIFVAGFATV